MNTRMIYILPSNIIGAERYYIKKPIEVGITFDEEDKEYLATQINCSEYGYGETEEKAIEDVFNNIFDLYIKIVNMKDGCLGKCPLQWKAWLIEHIGKR